MILRNSSTGIVTKRFYTGNADLYSLQINDISGKPLFVKKGISIAHQYGFINVAYFGKGIYFITLTNRSGNKIIKFIKEQAVYLKTFARPSSVVIIKHTGTLPFPMHPPQLPLFFSAVKRQLYHPTIHLYGILFFNRYAGEEVANARR